MTATTTEKTMSPWAEVAKLLRIELKAAFPETKFRIKSESYSMGNSVNIYWTDGPTRDQVREFAAKYEAGHFDGMTDCYNYNREDNGLPHTKYVMCNREMADETRARITAEIAKEYGVDMEDHAAVHAKFGSWADQVVYRRWNGGL